MDVSMSTLANAASFFCFSIGAIFWLWGSAPLLRSSNQRDSILFNLHTLSVSDTLGSMSIIVGLLFQLSREWPLLLLALFSLAIWNTVLSYVLAYCYYAGRDVMDKYGVKSDEAGANGLGTNGLGTNGLGTNGSDVNSSDIDGLESDGGHYA